MANDLNLCVFIGRLGADPETKMLPSGGQVTSFRIAVGWKGKDTEGVEWVRCVAWGKLAEICAQYLAKGKQVQVTGSMRTRKWQGNDGQDRHTTEIVLSGMQMLGSKGDSTQSRPVSGSAYPDDDDIPF